MIIGCVSCASSVSGDPAASAPSGPKIEPPRSTAAPAPVLKVSTTPIAFHKIRAASASAESATAMCRELFADPASLKALVKVSSELGPVTTNQHTGGVLDCVYPATETTQPGLELQVGTKADVYDTASNMALYSNDIAISADWDGDTTVDDSDRIRDYLQDVLDRITD